MNWKRPFVRKVIYIAAIAALLIPLSILGQPSTRTIKSDGSGETESVTPGGVLAQLRAKHNLSQAELGEIDPAAETMKLLTFGLRHVAAMWLWEKYNEFKKTEDYDNMEVTANQITKVEPNFIKVWEFHAHGLSYNVSAEFDDYRHRYHWVKKGINFLIRGSRVNRNDAGLLWNIGWFVGQKIGQSDEQKEFRAMFREDDEFLDVMTKNQIDIERAAYRNQRGYDNWLVSREWYLKAERLVERLESEGRKVWFVDILVDRQGERQGEIGVMRKSPLVFYSDAPMSLINFALAYIEDFKPGEVAQSRWLDALNSWREFGQRQVRSSLGSYVRLGDTQAKEEVARLTAKLDELTPGVRARLEQEKRDKLREKTPSTYAALVAFEKAEDPDTELENPQRMAALDAKEQIVPTHSEVAENAPLDKRDEAKLVAAQLIKAIESDRIHESHRQIVNYPYWEARCLAESTDEATLARLRLFEAEELNREAKYDAFRIEVRDPETGEAMLDQLGDPVYLQKKDPETGEPLLDENGQPIYEMADGARQKYEQAWQLWAGILERHPTLLSGVIGDDLMKPIVNYRNLLLRTGADELPKDFPLKELLDRDGGEHGLPSGADVDAFWDKKEAPPGTTPDATKEPEQTEEQPPSKSPADPATPRDKL